MDDYKVKYLKEALTEMGKDKYFIPKVRVTDGRYLDLDEGAMNVLINYYEKTKEERK